MPPVRRPSAKMIASLQAQIVKLCESHGEMGITKDTIEQSLADAPRDVLLLALNGLLEFGRMAMNKTSTGAILFKMQSEQQASLTRSMDGLSAEDRLVYQEIERAGNAGIRSKDLRLRANLQQHQVTKVLKTLENRGLIRAIKSIAAKNQKLYILAGLEPSIAVTGGAWYTDDQEFDHALIQVLQQASLEFIARSVTLSATAQQVLDFITTSGLIRGKPLGLTDIDSILQSLVFDARLEITRDISTALGGQRSYKLLQLDHSFAPNHTRVPCFVCPSFDQCMPGADVNPEDCEYLTRWIAHGSSAAIGAGNSAELSW